MPTSSENNLLWRNPTGVLGYNEKSVAIGRERHAFPRRQSAFDAWDAHSQADEPPLSFVMEFNADEREWHESQARWKKMLEDIEKVLAQQGR
jgi:hypothetical protein